MKLQEVFDQLSYGELSQISIGGGEMGVINEANYDRVLSHINLGLTTLYKRFNLKEGQIDLALIPGMLVYELNSNYAASNRRSRVVNRYLLDSLAAPFTDDIHKVERVYGDTEFEFSLNDHSNEYSIFTPSTTSLRVPYALVNEDKNLPDVMRTSNLTVVYRANHPKIIRNANFFDPSRVELELPDSYLEPLLLFVASRVNNPIGMTNEFNAGNNYAAKFEQACELLKVQNLQVDQGSQSSRLVANGWV